MARYSIDVPGVSRARAELGRDPATLRECSVGLSVATARLSAAVRPDAPELSAALDRFRAVHAHALDAVASAAEALGGRVDLAASSAMGVEGEVAAALAAGTVGHL